MIESSSIHGHIKLSGVGRYSVAYSLLDVHRDTHVGIPPYVLVGLVPMEGTVGSWHHEVRLHKRVGRLMGLRWGPADRRVSPRPVGKDLDRGHRRL